MSHFKRLSVILIFFTFLISCKEEESIVVTEDQTAESTLPIDSSAVMESVPPIDPSTVTEPTPINLSKMNGVWKATFVWTPNTGWQELTYGPSADFYYGTFLYYNDIWTIDFSEITFKNSNTNLSAGPYSLYYINTLEVGFFFGDISATYSIQAYQDNNALLMRSLYEDASEPDEYYWFVKQ